MDIVFHGILHRRHNFGIVTLDGDREAVCAAKTLVGFLQGKHAGGSIGQQMRQVGVQSETGFNENGEGA